MGGYAGIYDSFWDTYYGNTRYDFGGLTPWSATGQVWGTNPAYTFSDLLAVYPKFFGPATAVTGTLTVGSNEVVPFSNFVGVAPGQMIYGLGIGPGSLVMQVTPYPIALTGDTLTGSMLINNYAITSENVSALAIGQNISCIGIPEGATITAFDRTTLTLSLAATGTAIGVVLNVPAALIMSQVATTSGMVNLSVYQSPPMPLMAVQMYINLAQSSLSIGMYSSGWLMAMALFVAHYCTLFMLSESGPNATAQQIAQSGLQRGIVVSSSVGDVSKSAQLNDSFADWGSFPQTSYGLQLVTMAQGVAMGPIWIR